MATYVINKGKFADPHEKMIEAISKSEILYEIAWNEQYRECSEQITDLVNDLINMISSLETRLNKAHRMIKKLETEARDLRGQLKEEEP